MHTLGERRTDLGCSHSELLRTELLLYSVNGSSGCNERDILPGPDSEIASVRIEDSAEFCLCKNKFGLERITGLSLWPSSQPRVRKRRLLVESNFRRSLTAV